MKKLDLFLATFTVLLLNGCAASTSTSPTPAAANIYTTNVNGTPAGQILSFPTMSSGTATPAATLTATTGNAFQFLAFDINGNLYATAGSISLYGGLSGQETIQVYTHNTAGALTLSRSFTCTCLSGGGAPITVDKNGTVYATQGTKVYAFSPTATGTVTPTITLSGYGGYMTTDASGNLYIQSYSLTVFSINVFNAGFTSSSTPSRIITTGTPSLGLGPIAVDASGNLYAVAPSNGSIEIVVYAPTANGVSTPTRIITGSATKLVQPTDIAVDAAGNLYVADIAATAPGLQFYLEFSPTANGNVAPTASFSAAGATYGDEAIAVY